MDNRLLLITLFFMNTVVINGQWNSHRKLQLQEYNDYGIKKLFVFGDSYADTGNIHQMFQRPPYGISFRGKPSGRFSDGIIFTDFLAKFLGMKTPVPYHWRKSLKTRLHYGMNFAYGGAGVFETLIPSPNISTQIHQFEQLVKDSLYTKCDLESSLVLLTLSGNDYSAASARGDNATFIIGTLETEIINQLVVDLKRIEDLGVKRIAVGSLPPLGCLPTLTKSSSYKSCNFTGNALSDFHNYDLKTALEKLNSQSLSTTYTFLDLEANFTTILDNKKDATGTLKFPTPYTPCCKGIGDNSCGDVNPNGEKMYTVCKNPGSSFFWDNVHPTQAGWKAVFTALEPAFDEICSLK